MTTSTMGEGSLSPQPPHGARSAGRSRVAPAGPRVPGFRGFTVRHPIAALLVLVFSIAYPVMALPVLAMHGVIPGKDVLEGLPRDPDELSGLMLTWLALLPSAVYVTWAVEGREGIRRLFRRVLRWRFAPGWWLFILTAMPVLSVVAGLLLGDSVRSIDPAPFVVSQLAALLVNLVLINLWEETAWAGVLQTRLERRHNVFVAALLAAVPFGFAHWPLAFFGDVTSGSAAVALAAYLTLGVIFRPMLGVFLRGTRDSVLLVALLHSVFNRTNNDNGIAASLLDGQGQRLAMLIAAVALTGATALVIRRHLGRAERAALDAVHAAR